MENTIPNAEVAQAPATQASPSTVATVGVDQTAAGDLAKLIPANGQVSPLTVVLAGIAVLGGGAGWKFYSQHSKQKHEERMAEIESKRDLASRLDEEAKKEFKAVSQSLSSSAREVAIKLEDMNRKISLLSDSVDKLDSKFDDVEDKVHELKGLAGSIEELSNRCSSIETTTKKLAKATKAKSST